MQLKAPSESPAIELSGDGEEDKDRLEESMEGQRKEILGQVCWQRHWPSPDSELWKGSAYLIISVASAYAQLSLLELALDDAHLLTKWELKLEKALRNYPVFHFVSGGIEVPGEK